MTGDIFQHGRTVTITLDDIDHSLAELSKEAEAEIKMRVRVYARRVENGHMTPQASRRQIARMCDIRTLLHRLAVAVR